MHLLPAQTFKHTTDPSKPNSTVLILLALLCFLPLAKEARANTAAGVVLTNTVTVDYDDTGGNAQTQISASVDITVDHVPSVAWGNAPSGQTADSGGGLSNPYEITLTNTGNGADSYTIIDNTTQSCTSGTLGAESFSSPTPVALGATVASGTANPGSLTVTVPDDTNTTDNVTRGIAVLDTLMIGTQVVTVTNIAENSPAGSTTISFTPALASGNGVNIGDQIGETTTYSYGATGTAGAVSSGGTGCQHSHELAATGSTETGGNTAATDTVNGWSTTVEGVTLTIDKYVRNITNASKNSGGAAITYNSTGYYTSGNVSGNPGDTLEYLVIITNDSDGNATNVELNDTLPTFTSYETGTIQVDTNGNESFDVTTGTPGAGQTGETEADNEAGIITQSGSSITVFAGTGGNEDSDTGGNISNSSNAPNNKSTVLYRITID